MCMHKDLPLAHIIHYSLLSLSAATFLDNDAPGFLSHFITNDMKPISGTDLRHIRMSRFIDPLPVTGC